LRCSIIFAVKTLIEIGIRVQTASGQYTAAEHEYQRGYRNIKDAVRIFLVLRRSVNTEEMFRDHPAGYDEPRIIKRYRNVDIWLSTAN